jgi:CO/xanthine dehydrogenase Mo-binding subunit
MRPTSNLNRREFLKAFSTAGTGLLLGVYLSACDEALPESPTAIPSFTPTIEPTSTIEPTETPGPNPTPNPEASFEASLFLSVDGRGLVTLYLPKIEMGQGTLTSLSMVAADELDVDLSQVQVELSPIDPAYGKLRTAGSDSIQDYFSLISQTGSIARAMLVSAAARLWEVPYETCRTEDGSVFHDQSEAELTYAQLVETAAEISIPDVVGIAERKDAGEYKIIGQPIGHMDCQEIVDGSAIYGMDVNLPDMSYATVARCPVVRGNVAAFNADQALAVPGVQQVFEIDSGVAVVADSTWAAMQGQRALEITWDEGRHASLSTADLRESYLAELGIPESFGNEEKSGVLEAVYEVPFFAHAPPEPMNCVADVRPGSCQVWAPTQELERAMRSARSVTGLPQDAIQIHVPRIGGGFGRRLQVDYVEQAVEISMKAGVPVKVTWRREEDIQQGYFHPFSLHHAKADLGDPGVPRITSQTHDSWDELTYAWRSVTNFTDAFVQECFIDEMAAALDRDPLELRLAIEPPSLHSVLELAASKAGWGASLPPGRGRGIACWSTWGVTPVAQVAEVFVSSEGEVRVERVVCAIDPGLVINPDMVAAQMEGGIVWGLTAALKESIEFENGRVQQSNFDDYPLLRFDEMPLIEVHLIESRDRPTGVGEMGVPPAAPAIFNAIYNATDQRIRRMPLRPGDLQNS